MKLQKFVLLLIYMLLLCGTIYGHSTSSQISMSRELSDSICLPGQEILVEISLQFESLSNDAKGVYIADNIPSLLFNSLQTLSVELDGVDISDSVLIESESSESVYDGAITVRWVLETPPGFNENLPVESNQDLIVKYTLTIPADATDNTKYSFPNASWVAAIDPVGTPTYEFGHEDFPNPFLMVDVTPVPDQPILVSPSNESVVHVQPTTVNWLSSERAVGYRLQISTDTSFTSLVVDSSSLVDTFYTLPQLNNFSTYYWRVVANNVGGESDWSDYWEFSILGVPSSPILISPENNIELSDTTANINFVWSSVDLAESYTIEAAPSDDFDSLIVSVSELTDTNFTFSNDLLPGNFHWRVNGKNQAGVGEWSEVFTFIIKVDVTPVPDQPILVSPSNESVVHVQPTTVNWLSSDRAVGYRLQISTDTSFTSLVVDSSSLVDTFYTLPQLNNFSTYYWRVVANNVGGESDWSDYWKFSILGVPSSPILITPENNIELSDTTANINFVWSSVDLAESYTIEAAPSDDFDSLVVSVSELTDTSFTFSNDLLPGNFHWRVNAKNEAGVGEWSEVFTFIIKVDVTPVPDQPILVSPSNESVVHVQPTTVNWLSSERAVGYRLQISTDTSFTSLVVDSSSLVDTFYTLPQLNNFSSYYWRVVASNVGGESDWSDYWKFSILGVPSSPILISPENNIELSDTTANIKFVWSSVELAESYTIEAAASDDFDSLVVSVSELTDTSFTFSNDLLPGNFHWRVNAKNEAGVGEWSEVFTFILKVDVTPVPDQPILVSPSNESVVHVQPTSVNWLSSERAVGYRLQISTDTSFTSLVVDSSSLVDTFYTLPQLNNFSSYYWRVVASNVGGESDWSDYWKFSILGVPSSPILISPENNIELSDTTANIKFVWSSVELAESYTIEAAASDDFDSLVVSVSELTDTSFTFSNDLLPGNFHWRVNAKNEAGVGEWSEVFTITIFTVTDVENLRNIIPQEYILHQNYPNPFNPSTIIKYGVPEQSNIKIEIFNMLGQSVQVLVNTEKSAGFYETTWHADNLPSGIYLISIRAQRLSSKKYFTKVNKSLLLK